MTSAALALALAAPALAEDVTYPGVNLQDILSWGYAPTPALAPSGSAGGKSPVVTGSAATPANRVTVQSGTVDDVLGAVNTLDADSVSYNQVFINGGTVGGVNGGWHHNQNGDASAENNSIVITGGTINGVTGGYAESNASNATASGNTVTVLGGTFGGVEGGFVRCANQCTANDNTVNIQGGTIEGPVTGGYARNLSFTSIASNNTVRISGTPNLAQAMLFGGEAWVPPVTPDDGRVAISSGNTLEIATSGLNVLALFSFQNLDFKLPANSGSTVLTVARTVNLDANTTVHVSADPGLPLHPGDEFTLIGTSSEFISGGVAAASRSGTLNGYTYTIEQGPRALVLRIGGPVTDKQPGPGPYDGIYRITNADGTLGDYVSVHSSGGNMIATLYRSAAPVNTDSFALIDLVPPSTCSLICSPYAVSRYQLYKWGSWDLYSGTIAGDTATLTGYASYGLCNATASVTFNTTGGTVRVTPTGASAFAPPGSQPACDAAAAGPALEMTRQLAAPTNAPHDGIYRIANADGTPGDYVSVHSSSTGVIATVYRSATPVSQTGFVLFDGDTSVLYRLPDPVATLYRWGSWDLYSGALAGDTATLTGYVQYGLCNASATLAFGAAGNGTISVTPAGASAFAPAGPQPTCDAAAGTVTLNMSRQF